jgi:hypothetical protein
VAGELQLADDFRAQQRHDVGADGEFEAGKDLFGDRRAAYEVPAFEDQDFLAGPRQVRGSGQAIVAATNDDGVVLGRHDIDISRNDGAL